MLTRKVDCVRLQIGLMKSTFCCARKFSSGYISESPCKCPLCRGQNGDDMEIPKIFESEYRFCLILWETGPINSTALVKLCDERLGWKKATTYTVIKRLEERGVLKNEGAVVSTLVTKDEVQTAEIDEMVDRTFSGSVPAFLAAFSRSKKLSPTEISELKKLVNSLED